MRKFAVLAAMLSLISCARYEWRSACAFGVSPFPPLQHRASLDRQAREGRGLRGVLVEADSAGAAVPIAAATVLLEPGAARRFTDEGGAFAFDSLPSGTYRLTVRHVAYMPWAETVQLPAESAVVVRVGMDRAPGIDDCGMLRVRVRKPWWKLW